MITPVPTAILPNCAISRHNTKVPVLYYLYYITSRYLKVVFALQDIPDFLISSHVVWTSCPWLVNGWRQRQTRTCSRMKSLRCLFSWKTWCWPRWEKLSDGRVGTQFLLQVRNIIKQYSYLTCSGSQLLCTCKLRYL